MDKSPSSRFKRIARRISRITLRVIIILLLLLIIFIFLLQTSFVQNFGRKKIQAYLESKLHTKVIIGELSVDFPKNILLKTWIYFRRINIPATEAKLTLIRRRRMGKEVYL